MVTTIEPAGDVQMVTGKPVGAVENAVRILRWLALSTERHVSSGHGAASIARANDINVSTCFNILRTLVSEGLVAFDEQDKTYSLGLGVLEIAAPLLGTDPADRMRTALNDLASSHSVLMALWAITENERIVLVDRVVDSRILHVDMMLGSRLPAHVGAIGRCVAAVQNLSGARLKRTFAALRWQNAPTLAEYEADVKEARRTGFALDRGQLFTGMDIAAAVVCDPMGRPRFGISGIVVAGQIDDDALVALGQDIARRAAAISGQLFTAPQSMERRSPAPVTPLHGSVRS